jgi:hypothetical protein
MELNMGMYNEVFYACPKCHNGKESGKIDKSTLKEMLYKLRQ